MKYLIIALTSATASGLTLFSGFGLGTLLTPAFSLFFPVPVAVAQTAVVHMANNLFKAGLFARHADRRLVMLFGLPALVTSLAGAGLLVWLSDLPALFEYTFGGRHMLIHPVKLVVGALMAAFALLDMRPAFDHWAVDPRYLPLGGALSGFFGGLSGNQGAFRSAFLLHAGLSKEAFIATGVAIAVMVDISRLAAYAQLVGSDSVRADLSLIAVATVSAFAGALIGRRLVRKVTIEGVRRLVAAMLLVIALMLAAGVL